MERNIIQLREGRRNRGIPVDSQHHGRDGVAGALENSPIILRAGLPSGSGFFGAAVDDAPPLPALLLGAFTAETAPAAFSAAGVVLGLSDMLFTRAALEILIGVSQRSPACWEICRPFRQRLQESRAADFSLRPDCRRRGDLAEALRRWVVRHLLAKPGHEDSPLRTATSTVRLGIEGKGTS
nr:hypothetical protein CFP56_01065 [Quercus suber]